MNKEIKLEGWINYHGEFDWDVYRRVSDGYKPDYNSITCTITFEIEVPEPKREVTPSMIDALWYDYNSPKIIEYNGNEKPPLPKYKSFSEFLNSKLFGKEQS